MNKNLYRIVFNKARDMLVVVAEITRSCRAVACPSSGAASVQRQCISRLNALSFGLLLALCMVQPAVANVVADRSAPGSQQPTIFNSANGTPQVNIQSPSQGGVSHNVYSQFDVDNKGVILNNSRNNTSTQLGGMVAGNPWLARGEAKIILNEVNSRDPSKLNGYIEVAGKKAQVVIANPSGISCNGCGFINANRATLTTGQAQLQNGNLTGYTVNKGEISIQGKGMDTSRQDYTDIIARSVSLNAGLWANDVKVTAGASTVDAAHEKVTAQDSDAASRPQFAVDVSSLGGMYAGKIRLTGTEKGVGVRNAGNVGALAGTVVVTADGHIENSGNLNSSGDMQLAAGGLTNSGHIFAGGSANIASRSDITHSGTLAASENLNLQGARVTATAKSTLGSGIRNDGSVADHGDLRISSDGRLTMQGQNIAAGVLSAQGQGIDASGSRTSAGAIALDAADGDIDLRQAQLETSGKLAAHSTGSIVNDDGVLSGNSVALDAQHISNRQGNITQTGDDDMLLAPQASLNNDAGRIATNAQNFTLQSAEISNTGGEIVHAGKGTITVTTPRFRGDKGEVASAGALILAAGDLQLNEAATSARQVTITADNLSHRNASMVQNGAGEMSVTTTGALDNEGSTLAANGDMRLTAGSLNNHNGKAIAAGDGSLSVQVRGAADNTQGTLVAGKHLELQAATLANNSGAIGSNLNASLHTNLLDNAGGTVQAGQGLLLDGSDSLLTVSNRAGSLVAGQQMDVTADAISGDGKVLSDGDMTLSLQQGFTNQSQMIANGNLMLTSGGAVDNQGKLLAGKNLTLQAARANNAQGAELGGGETHLSLSDALVNRGLIDGSLTHIETGTLTNLGSGRIYGDHLAIKAATLNNIAENGVAATLAARDRLDIASGALNNTGHGLIYSAGEMAIGGDLDSTLNATGRGGIVTNRGSTIESGGDMRLDMAEIHNLNNNLVTEIVVTGQTTHHEAVLSGKTQRFDWSQVDTGSSNKYGVHTAKMPDGSRDDEFYEYNYTRTTQETRVNETDPAKILSGGNLTINSGLVHNKDSLVIAAKLLSGVISVLNNDATSGVKIITDIGGQTRWYAKKKKRRFGGTKTSQGKDWSSYRPSPVTQTLSLSTLAWQSNGLIQGSDEQPESRDSGQFTQPVSLTFNGAQPVQLPAGQSWQVGQNVSDTEGNTPDRLVRTSGVDTRLPSGSLYTVNASPDSDYLVETDPRFTNEREWMSSDYMQKALSSDGDTVLKRLGDGFYEQQLVRDQITHLTGQRYLGDFDDDNTQYKALMDAGIAFAREHNLAAGVALSSEQMALLTSDMVWMVEQTVQLPDGSSERVLVPQVYVRVKQGDVDGNGSLLGGRLVSLQTADTLNNSGTIAGRDVTALSAGHVNNSGLIRGSNIDITALTDFNNIGGTLLADDALQIKAGRDINSSSTLTGGDAGRSLDRTAGIYVQNDSGKLALQSVNDINLNASMLGNNGKKSATTISAGNNLNLATITTTHSEHGEWGSETYRDLSERSEVGSQISGNGTVRLSAGNDLNARAASVNAADALDAVAGNDMNIIAGESAYHLTEHSKQTSKGFLSASSLETHDEVQASQAVASNLTGDSVTLLAGNNLAVRGSNVAGENAVRLAAGNDLTIDTVEEQRQENHLRHEGKSGLMGTGGIGFSVGRQSLKTTDDGRSTSHAISTVGSSAGSLSLEAGNDLTARSAELIAGKDMTLTGKNVAVTAASDRSEQTHKVEQKQSGFTLALSGAVGSALNTAVETASQAQSTQNSRVAALQNTKAALSGVQAAQAAMLASAQSGTPAASDNTIGISLSYGSQSSSSVQNSEQITARGGSLTAGDNVKITANGSGAKGLDGDILLQGATVQAGKNVDLTANRDINLLSAGNTQQQTGSNKSSGGTVGVGIGVGSGGWGISVSASLNKGKGSETGNGTTHSETLVNTGQEVNLVSGRDTTLTGAQVSGEKVTAEVGRNLTLTSEQDSDRYDSKQQNASVGGSFTFGSMTGSASVNLSRDKMHSNYDSVVEQTGIYAGKGGFDVTVGEHTQLNGAVIGSTATADNNRLDTGTLGFSDIHNQADYKVEHQSVGFSTGGNIGGQALGNMANTLLAGVNSEGHNSGTTRAAVSDGSLIIRDTAKQTQDAADLSRDVEHANGSISQIFDKEKEQQRIQQAQLIGEIGVQVGDIIRTQGAISAAQAAKESMGDISQDDVRQAREDWIKANPGKTPTDADINAQVYQNYYDSAFSATGMGTGGAYQQGIQAATAVIQGLAGGNVGAALANGAAPYLAEVIGHDLGLTDNAKVVAHAIAGAALAAAQGQNAAAGAAGAATGELAARVLKNELYGENTRTADLTETQKQTLSALATLSAGLAGGIAGDSTGSAAYAAQAGKVTAENNYLSYDEAHAFDKEITECKATGNDCSGIINNYAALSAYNRQKLHINIVADPLTVLSGEEKWNIEGGIAAAERPSWLYGSLDNQEVRDYVREGNRYDLSYLNSNTSNGDRALAFFGEPENFWGTVAGAGSLLSSSATLTEKLLSAGLSYGANGAVQVATGNLGDKFDYISFMMSGLTGAGTAGKSYYSNQLLGAGSAYMGSEISGQDSQASVLGSMAGTGLGYNIGASVTNKFESQYIKKQLGMDTSKNALKYSEFSFGPGYLLKGGEMSSVPGIAGGAVGSLMSEGASSGVQQEVNGGGK